MASKLYGQSSLLELAKYYFFTIIHLRPMQLYGRLIRPFKVLDLRPPTPMPLKIPKVTFTYPLLAKSGWKGENKFSYLNECRLVSGWNDEDVSLLWLYKLHYFDDLNANDSQQTLDEQQALILWWIKDNPPAHGVGWDAYPSSLRIVNWIKWSLRTECSFREMNNSLGLQAKVLAQNLEIHLLGNHLFANAKALLFAGLYFNGREGDRWLEIGLKILSVEIHEQVLKDGGNFELSPMYHAIFLMDLLDILAICLVFEDHRCVHIQQSIYELISPMLRWMAVMTHPDGETAFFNDSAVGFAPNLTELTDYARALGVFKTHSIPRPEHISHLVDSGYIRLCFAASTLILDVGRVGPNYLPGHAHADSLSFELSLFGQRVFVNCGTSEYGNGRIRSIERSTGSHNTVVVNGENSSEVWGGFRVARRAYPQGLSIEDQNDSVTVACSHDGYRRLAGKPMHRRTWQFSESALVVSDHVDGHFDHAIACFHVHPSVTISSVDAGGWLLKLAHGQKILVNVEAGVPQWSPSHYAPEFGMRLETQCLKVVLGKNGSRVRMAWSSFD